MNKQTFLLTALTSLVVPSALFAADAAAIKAPLHATGDPDATGVVMATLKPKKSELIIQANNLVASHSYAIEVAGIVEGMATTDSNGRAKVRFAVPAVNNVLLLDFDPRGQSVRILDGAVSVLEGVISGSGEDNSAVMDERADLAAVNAPAKARAQARYTVTAKGRRTFRVDLANLTDGPFKVLVNGVERGEVTLHGKAGLALFDSAPVRPGVLALDFDPRGAVVDVVTGATVIFSGTMEAKAGGVNVASPSVNRVAIPSTGADPDGTATARLRIDKRARKHFSVEVENIPAGNYDLYVEGAGVGTIAVVAVTGGTEGEVEFTNGDDDPSELPLTFDPAGKTLTIAQGVTKFFEGEFDPNVTGSGTPAPESPSQLDEALASTGLDADASAEARHEVDAQGRHKFSVEIEDLAAGAYTLTVGGVARGTINAKLVAGKVKGEIEFESENESGHRLLDFDPRGQTLEISSSTGVFFSHLLGSGSAGPGGTAVTPFDLIVPLISSGADADATAKAEYQQKENGERCLEVETEDLAVGAYDLLVGGLVRGTINVAAASHGTRGKLEFDTESGAGRLALNFEVAGQEVVIRQGATQFFSRTFPTP
ncbi:MAG: hypothetical protein QOE70_2250 [Chthoniobacter sp.]|jgi:hypothetical protein|nr:hypothetical protein [Chthoniobacter sp.]